MNEKSLAHTDLLPFTGTTVWYRHRFVRNILYTEGVQYLAERGGAYWLIDELAFAQSRSKVRAEPFQLWKLTVKPDRTAVLCCEDGNGTAVYRKRISFTDFPLEEIVLYYTDRVILLPGEY